MSVAYFPSVYPDELIYSVLARYSVHSGYLNYREVAKDLFFNFNASPEIEFINRLKPEIMEQLTRRMDWEEIIKEHTMFSYYGRFLPRERKIKAFQALRNMTGNYNDLLAIPKRKTSSQRFLRFCPLCVKTDRQQYGETYWHRQHQIPQINICPEHGCRLSQSNVTMSGTASPKLISAEQEAVESEDILYGNGIEKCIAKYMQKLLWSDMNMTNDIPVGEFFHSRMSKTKYLSVRGEQRNIKQFYQDFMNYYVQLPEQGLTELWQIQKVLTNYRCNPYEICQMAMFLDISVEDLNDRKLPQKSQPQMFDELVEQMYESGGSYNQIARELGVSSRTVRLVGKQTARKKKQYSAKCGAKSNNWEQIDKENLPLVRTVIQQLWGQDNERPHRVTEYAVSKKMGFSDKKFQQLPLCREEILKYQECQEQYWAREVIWAVNKIQQEGKPLNWKHIRVLTNMKKENLKVCLPYLEQAEKEVMTIVKGILP